MSAIRHIRALNPQKFDLVPLRPRVAGDARRHGRPCRTPQPRIYKGAWFDKHLFINENLDDFLSFI